MLRSEGFRGTESSEPQGNIFREALGSTFNEPVMAGRLSPRVTSRFVLASGSPRRRELLEKAGYEFDIVLPAVTEISGPWLTVREATICNAMRKAVEVAQSAPGAVVLGADTLVVLDGRVIGKPADLAGAVRILRRLSG